MKSTQPAATTFNPHYNSLNTASKIILALERITEAFRVMLWQASKTTGLSPLQIQILTFLLYHLPQQQRTVSYLAQEFNMTKPTISDAIKSLQEKGLIRKESSLQDSRSYTIFLTEDGTRLANTTAVFAQYFHNALAEMPPIEQELLLEYLITIIRSLHKQGFLTIQRTCFTCRFHTQHPMHSLPPYQSYCTLLDVSLHSSDIRLDCPHHESPVSMHKQPSSA
ncbi:MAG: MarR family winged helix-turn-helix transcriptional regulator [Bacteroidota bacterium]|nr:MarR family winged helix-turn-helix transcriptional regulator [Candidatus Kapabacteria bacterium]MDW8219308.1 MarR family winged helix-turn-helix transcriptional regulator [Bacteroidota bacterium]